MQEIFGSFPAILKELDVDGAAVETVVFAAWNRCVDGVLSENVVPLRLERNRLIVAVPTETWLRNVADLGPALAAKLNNALGSPLVRFIEFQVDADAVIEARSRSGKSGNTEPGHALAAARIRNELRLAAEMISDEQLRGQFLAAASSSLARREADES